MLRVADDRRELACRQETRRQASGLQVYPLRQRQRVVEVNTEIPNRAVHLGVAQQKLNRPQIARLLVYLSHIGPAHRMGAIGAWLWDRHFAQELGGGVQSDDAMGDPHILCRPGSDLALLPMQLHGLRGE